MPKDNRLFARIDLDLPEHPKYLGLSDAAKLCLYESILWARKYQTDGFLPNRLAGAKWSLETLAELCANDPRKPSLTACDDGWYIHDFADHQDTRAEIDARRERNKAAGQMGGLAKAKRGAKRTVKQVAKRGASETLSENLAETETDRENPYGFSPVPPTPLKPGAAPPNGAAPGRPRDPFAAEADLEDAQPDYGARAQAIARCSMCDEDGYRPNRMVCDHIDHQAQTVAGRSAAQTVLAELRAKKAARNSEPRP